MHKCRIETQKKQLAAQHVHRCGLSENSFATPLLDSIQCFKVVDVGSASLFSQIRKILHVCVHAVHRSVTMMEEFTFVLLSASHPSNRSLYGRSSSNPNTCVPPCVDANLALARHILGACLGRRSLVKCRIGVVANVLWHDKGVTIRDDKHDEDETAAIHCHVTNFDLPRI